MVTYSSINFDFILLDLISFCFVGFVSFRFGLASHRFGMLSFVSVYFVSSLRFVSFALCLHFTDTPDLWYYFPRHIKINTTSEAGLFTRICSSKFPTFISLAKILREC